MLDRGPQYTLLIARTDAYCVIRAAGELDIASVAELSAVVGTARRGAERIVMDLRGVTFMDSFALRALVRLQGDDLHFHVIAGGSVQRVLDLTGARAALRWISPEQLAA